MKLNKKFAIIGCVVAGVILLIGAHYFTSKFRAGECIRDNEGYVWHIDGFSMGYYFAYNDPDGNLVKIDKDLLERKIEDGVPKYRKTKCKN